MKILFSVILLVLIGSISCQDRGLGRRRANRGALVAAGFGVVAGGLVVGVIARASARREEERLKLEHTDKMEQIVKYYDSSLQYLKRRNEHLSKVNEECLKEAVERDYEEFKAPDMDNDDMISREEFDTYIKKYLSSFPELSEKDFPKFDEFDKNHDGIVSFDEWQEFLILQKEKEKLKSLESKDSTYNDLLEALYKQTNEADGFNSLQKNLAANQRGKDNTS